MCERIWYGSIKNSNDTIENEYGSYGSDKVYLSNLVSMARGHLGDDIIVYTIDGGTRETLEKGIVPVDDVYSAVDFSTGDDPWPKYKLQKKFNAPGRSSPLCDVYPLSYLLQGVLYWLAHAILG